MMQLTVNNKQVTCPETENTVNVRSCFGCDCLRSVSPKDGGELQCSYSDWSKSPDRSTKPTIAQP